MGAAGRSELGPSPKIVIRNRERLLQKFATDSCLVLQPFIEARPVTHALYGTGPCYTERSLLLALAYGVAVIAFHITF